MKRKKERSNSLFQFSSSKADGVEKIRAGVTWPFCRQKRDGEIAFFFFWRAPTPKTPPFCERIVCPVKATFYFSLLAAVVCDNDVSFLVKRGDVGFLVKRPSGPSFHKKFENEILSSFPFFFTKHFSSLNNDEL